jgi:Ulp1 family protease
LINLLVDIELTSLVLKVPVQPNSSDCGIYLLHFVEIFLEGPDEMRKVMLEGDQAHESTDYIDLIWEHRRVSEMRERLIEIVKNPSAHGL